MKLMVCKICCKDYWVKDDSRRKTCDRCKRTQNYKRVKECKAKHPERYRK